MSRSFENNHARKSAGFQAADHRLTLPAGSGRRPIEFAVEGKVRADIKTAPLHDINTIFANLKAGKVEGRMVLDLSQPAKTRLETGELAHA